ncbi:HNH endonuclease signature motif containing protein [uncultured Ramlibacter sp.]|uniref:HNH endonuclease n=1 Tax=uncultured Ramlibacter sp. TaxID=260755 RepID=UPI0026286211|nr:HNH endonuclease signature motif containing protein [uncultured Ramlibacter sp.]
MKLTTLKSTLPRLRSTLQGLPAAGDNRMRGRKAVNRRAAHLARQPLCVECEKEGLVTAKGCIADHTLPLWAGGKDEEANLQTLCQTPHHDAKSACEAAMRAAGGWMARACNCGQHRAT